MDNELTQVQKHNLEVSGVNVSPKMVAVVQYDEGTKDAVLLFNNQIIKTGEFVDVHGKKYLATFSVDFIGNVPDEKNVNIPMEFISVDRWDAKLKTIVSYTTPYYGPGIPAHPVVDQSGNVIKGAEVPAIPATDDTPEVPATYEYPQVPAIPNTMVPGRTVYAAVVPLVINNIEIKMDNHELGSRVVCGEVTLRRWSYTVPWTVFGYNAAPVPGHHPRPFDE